MSLIYPIYYRIYRMQPETVILLMTCGLLIWPILARLLGKRSPKIWKTVNAVLLALLAFAIVYYTILRRGRDDFRMVQLLPFASLDAAKHLSEIYRELMMNVLMFFPVGLLLSAVLPDKWSIGKRILLTLLAGILFSAAIELVQYFLVCGDVETDDVITNTIGTFIGTLQLPAGALLQRIYRPEQKE